MTINQLSPFLRGSFLDGVARAIDLGGNLGAMESNRILDQFGLSAIQSDLAALNNDAVKSLGVMLSPAEE